MTAIGSPRSRWVRWTAAAIVVLAGAAPLRAAEGAVPVQTGIEISSATQQALARLQEQWLQWVSAFYQNDPARARGAVDDLLGAARQLGMARLPDLSLAALSRAVESARGGNFERAGWALEAAGKLDGGRPEEAFAQAAVARLQGSYGRALLRHLEGWRRIAAVPLLRRVGLASLGLWLCGVVLLAGAFFLVLQMAARGGALWQELNELLAKKLPGRLTPFAALILLAWPLFLPKGLLWLMLYWSALLWGYGGTSERLVFVLIWLAMALLPGVVADRQRFVLAQLSPPGRALGQFAERRLSGGLFTDFGVLLSMLPQSVAARQVQADLHRTLGQWELSRPVYLDVVESEPENATALINLGNYFFRKGDFGKAVEYYRRAAAGAPTDPSPLYNLSQAYSESYLFDESRQALAQARALDESLVSRWVQESRPERVLSFDGGLARSREIITQLARAGNSETESMPPVWYLALPVAFASLLGLVLFALRRRAGRDTSVEGDAPRWLRILIPGLPSLERGAGFASYGSLLVFAGLFLLLTGRGPRLPVPWGFDPGNALGWFLVVLGFALFFGLRVRRELRSEE